MDVHLLIYDLSRGLARQMSIDLLGFQLDAIYHTSIELQGREYVYDGNIVDIVPGTSHLGQPLQRMYLGKTELPMDVIEEYLDSLREIYTVEAYDLFRHNCNNFSNDFAMFLLGKGIPEHIINMPQAVLESPLGQMIMPMLNEQVRATKQQRGGILGIQQQTPGSSVRPQSELHHHPGKVHNVSSLSQLDDLLAKYQSSCAVVFFTSATCPPCKLLYPLYDSLAAEIGAKGALIKIDVSQAFDVGARYAITATPTFITFLKGKQENRWSGADPAALRGNVQLLVQMAWPPHPHEKLGLHMFSNPGSNKPVIFSKTPPLDKVLSKLGNAASDPAVKALIHFLESRASQGPAEAPLPNLAAFTTLLRNSLSSLPADNLFPLIDLLRAALSDPRVSGLLAEEETPSSHTTISSILTHVNTTDPESPSSYPLRLVTLQFVANLFSSPLYPPHILSSPNLLSGITQLLTTSLLDTSHSRARVAAASLLYNLALANQNLHISPSSNTTSRPYEGLPEGEQLELAAAVVEGIRNEEKSGEALEGMVRALGWLVYKCDVDGAVADCVRALEAGEVVKGKEGKFGDGVDEVVGQVGRLLTKGL